MQGTSARDIAGTVKIKPRTSANHIENTKMKFGVSISHQAVFIWVAFKF